jgi:hypothetical protein
LTKRSPKTDQHWIFPNSHLRGLRRSTLSSDLDRTSGTENHYWGSILDAGLEFFWSCLLCISLTRIRVTLMIASDEVSNFELFRDCLSTVVIERLAPATTKPKKRVKGRKNEIKPVVQAEHNGETDAAELSEFTEVRNITSSSTTSINLS